MRILARVILVMFLFFLSLPTVVGLIEKNRDISMFYSMTEEEIHKELKEFKAEIRQGFDYPFSDKNLEISTKIISENCSKHDNIFEEIFSPPPEFI